jgi:trehalose utilization protein
MRTKLFILACAILTGLSLHLDVFAAERRVVVWSEATAPKDVYPNDINGAIVEGLAGLKGWEVIKAGIDDPHQGLDDARLNGCDVLVWWGHKRHGQVNDELVKKIVQRVTEGRMGFVSLHSAHFAKPNIALMSVAPTPKELFEKVQPKRRVAAWGAYKGDSLTLAITVTAPSHPIAAGVKPFTIAHSERYSDPYAVPTPQTIVFEGDAKLKDGKIDHSQVGLCWQIGKGRMFYFQAGHETNPVFYDANVRRIIANAIQWAAPQQTPGPKSAAAKSPADDPVVDQKYQTLVGQLPPDEQAWERTLQANLGSFYLPIHKRDRVKGVTNAWSYVKDDPRLPRVLLIGDSVSRGYTLAVRKALAGKANVHRAPENCGGTANGLKKLDIWLADGKWDLIHFNFGIHDRLTPARDYEERLEKIVARLQKSGAKLVWATTTPIPRVECRKQTPESIVQRNAIAARVMGRHGIAVDDLFTFVTPHLATAQIPNDVHFHGKGYELLGGQVAQAIMVNLGTKKP